MDSKVNILLLIFLLILPPVLGWFGYYLSVGSDQYEVIRFAEDLARGTLFRSHPVFDLVKDRAVPGRLYNIHYGGYLLKDGKIYCKYAVGYPLLLALSLKLFGFPSVFFVNFFVLSLLLLVVHRIGRIYFRDEAHPTAIALSAALLLFLLGRQIWDLSVTPHGDVASVLFAVLGIFCLLRALSSPPPSAAQAAASQKRPTGLLRASRPSAAGRLFWLFVAGFSVGCAGSIRPPSALIALPATLYLLSRAEARKRPLSAAVLLLLFAAGVLFGLLPVFAQNYLTGGNILRFTQFHEVHLETVRAAVGAADGSAPPVPLLERIAAVFLVRSHGWGIGNIHAVLPAMSLHVFLAFGPLFSALFLLGLAAGWRRVETRCLFFPAILLFLLFYSGWVRPLERYLVIAYPFVGLVAAGGAARLFSLSARPGAGLRGRVPLALLGAGLAVADPILRSLHPREIGLPNWQNQVLFAAALLAALAPVIIFLLPRRSAASRFNLALAAAIVLLSVPVVAAKPSLFQFPQARRFRSDVGRICRPPSVLFATKFLTQAIDLFTGSVSIRPFDLDFALPDLGRAYGLLLSRGFNLYLIDNRDKRDAAACLPAIRDYFAATPAGILRGSDYNLEERFGKPACTVYAIRPWTEREVDLDLSTPAPVDYLLTLNLRKIWDTLPPRSAVSAAWNGAPLPARFENGVNFLVLPPFPGASPRSAVSLASDRPLPPDVLVDLRWAMLDYVIDFGAAAPVPDRTFLEEGEAEEGEAGFRVIRSRARIALPPATGEGRRSVILAVRWEGGGAWAASLDGVPLAALPLRPSPLTQSVEIPLPSAPVSATRSSLELSGDSPLALESLRVASWGDSFALPVPEGKACVIRAGLKDSTGRGDFALELDGEKLAGFASGGEIWALVPASDLQPRAGALRLVPAGSGAEMRVKALVEVGYPFRIEAGELSGREFKGEGFYPPELYLGRTPFAWTSGAAEVYLPVLSVPAGGMVLKLGYIGGRPPGVPPARVEIELDGRPVGSFTPAAGMGEAELKIPPDLLRPGVGRLAIRANAWRPAERPAEGDTRPLGLMVRYLELSLPSALAGE